jgi:hypothetical protein
MAKKNREREDRIHNEIIVDANGPEEQAMGWYCYLQESLTPFSATCIEERDISPLHSRASPPDPHSTLKDPHPWRCLPCRKKRIPESNHQFPNP